MNVLRRAFAADRWPWTWSLLLVVAGLLPISERIAPFTLAAGIGGAALSLEVPTRARRDRMVLASTSLCAFSAAGMIGWKADLIPLVAVLAAVAAIVGDRYPHPPRVKPSDRRAARRARQEAQDAASSVSDVWQ